MAANKARQLKQDEVRELLSLDRDDITMDLLKDYFACFYGQDHAKFNTYDYFTLPAKNRQVHNEQTVKTTIGRYIVNLAILPEKYLEKYGYFNEVITKGSLGKLEDKMGKMVLNDEMTLKEYTDYLDRGEWIGMGTAYFLVPTVDYDINVPIEDVIKKRDEYFEEFKDGIAKGDPNVANKIEADLLAMAKKEIKSKGNESYDFFDSGVGSFDNNYKKIAIMGGAIENPYTKKLDIVKSNYIDGIDKKEFPKFANLSLIGGYSRGVETQSSGYETKKINNTLQVITLDEPGSDCGTKFYEEINLTDDIKNLFLYRYIIDPKGSGKLILLTDDNIKQYVGTTIKLRSPLYCKGDKICNKCAGELFYKLGVKNAGLLNSTLSGSLMNLSMKKFHDATVKFNRINISNFITKE